MKKQIIELLVEKAYEAQQALSEVWYLIEHLDCNSEEDKEEEL